VIHSRDKISNYKVKDTENSFIKSILVSMLCWDSSHKSIVSRIIFIVACLTLCFFIIVGKLLLVALTTPDHKNIYVKDEYFRREIVDRNGLLLAINLQSSSLFANPKKMIDLDDIDKAKLLLELKSSKNFVWIKRGLTQKERVEVHNLGIPGISFEEEPKRIYTYGNLLSHLIGYVGRDNAGLAGLEKSYNEYLTTKNIESKSDSEPLKLTIDARVQGIVDEELSEAISTFRADAGIAVVIDATNGEVISCISKPDFNPHEPSKATNEQLFNRYSLGVEEMGSIMKSITMAIGLETEKVTLQDVYDITSMRIAKFNLSDTHKAVGWHTVPEIFLHSSNIGMAQIILEIGKSDFRKYIERLGLLEKLKIELPEKGTPIYQNYDKWSDLTLATMSYGYALAITPLHFINAALPVVNGGYMYPIHFVKKSDAIEGTKVFSSSTSEDMRKLFRLVVRKGTGRKGDIEGYFVGAKTGTAEMRVGKRYVKNMRKSSFFAVTPVHDPKYAIYIMLDNPKPTKETFGFAGGAWTAAPVAKNIISRMMTLYGVAPYIGDPKIEDSLSVEYAIDEEA
jgi:cell division protein FtsI (penicillin-binding protein 3)